MLRALHAKYETFESNDVASRKRMYCSTQTRSDESGGEESEAPSTDSDCGPGSGVGSGKLVR